jgi:tetratricopeptide (TPR) repeat protein
VKAAEELGPLPRNLRLLDSSLALLASAFDSQRRYPDALATRLRSLQLLEQYHGEDSNEICVLLTNLAGTYTTLARFSDAEAAYKRVLAIKEKSDPKYVSGILMKLGQHFEARKKYVEAEITFKRLVVLYENDGGTHNPKLIPVLGYLATISRVTGREKEASAYTARAAAIRD